MEDDFITDTLREADSELSTNPALTYAGRVYTVDICDAEYEVTISVTRKGAPSFLDLYKEAVAK